MLKFIGKKIVNSWEDYSVGVAIFAIIGIIIGAIALWFGAICLQAWLVMLLWNWVAVDLFGAPVLSFWVAFGLRWLCSLLCNSIVSFNTKSDD